MDTSITLPILISVLLVFIEFFGIFAAKWTIAKGIAEKAAVDLQIEAILTLEKSGYPPNENRDVVIQRSMVEAKQKVTREIMTITVAGIVPGPELCFLAMTINISLFLAFNYATTTEIKIALSPLLEKSGTGALPTVLAAFLASLILWWLTIAWREAIIGGMQKRLKRVSMGIIAAIGGASVALCMYLLLAGR